MTTHLTRARWVTAARVLLPHWRTESRPCRHPRPTPAVHSPAYLVSFARFPNKRLIAAGKFECSVKDHLSMFPKLVFRVPRCNINNTFLRAFVKSWPFFASHRVSALGNIAGDCMYIQVYKARSSPRRLGPRSVGWGRPRRAGGGPAWSVSHQHGHISSRCGVQSLTLSRLAKAKKRQNICKCTQKMSFLLRRRTRNLSFKNMDRWSVLEFSDCDEPLFGNRA